MNSVLNPKVSKEIQQTETRVDPHVYEIGAAMYANAQELASKCDWLQTTINVIAKAKQDYEGGPFAVMFKCMEYLTKEQIDALPDPDAETGNNPGKFKVRTLNSKNKPVVKEWKYYHVLSDKLPGNILKQQRIDMLELSMKDPVQYNVSSVPQDIKDMDRDRRKADISKLEGELTTSRTNILAAFELLFHIRAVNALDGVTASVMYALAEDGKTLLDGEDGRDCVVENTKRPIVVCTTVEGRQHKDITEMSIGSFKKLRPDVALEKGGTYQALIDSAPTVKRGKKEDEPGGAKPERINTRDTFFARITDLHDVLDEWQTDTNQTQWAGLIGDLSRKEGSADNLISCVEVRDMLTDLLAKVFKASERYVEYTRQAKEAEEKAA